MTYEILVISRFNVNSPVIVSFVSIYSLVLYFVNYIFDRSKKLYVCFGHMVSPQTIPALNLTLLVNTSSVFLGQVELFVFTPFIL